MWQNKLKKVVDLNWSNEEKEHIQFLIDENKVGWYDFTNINNNLLKERRDFLNMWVSYAHEKLEWSKELLMAIGIDLNYSLDKNRHLLPHINDVSKGLPVGNKSCECATNDNWCTFDCESSHCESSPHGCGWFGMESCNGECGVRAPFKK